MKRTGRLSVPVRRRYGGGGGVLRGDGHGIPPFPMIVITAPIALFFLTQKTFIQGIALTGIKG